MPNLVTVVGENTHILPHMLKHYENLVDKQYVVVYRQSEDDNILEEIEELGITPYKVVTEPKYNWERVTELYNEVKATKPNDWWIVSDDDELQVYSDPIEDVIMYSERHGYDFVTGGFLDRIGPDGTFPEVNKDTNIHEVFSTAGFFRYPMSKACPNKVTLMKGKCVLTPGQHYIKFEDGTTSWGSHHPKRLPPDISFTQVHHFKWDSTCVERIKKVADNKKEYSFSHEYQMMYDGIVNNDFKIPKKDAHWLVPLTNFSYIDYNDYPFWDKLTNLIIEI